MNDLRASDSNREEAADRLRSAAGDGQLTMEELDERLSRAYEARTRGELELLTADLQSSELVGPAEPGSFSVRPGQGGARWLVGILGGSDRKGRWRLAARSTSLNILGGSNLDLTQVELAAERTELTVWSLLGGANLRVPQGLAVEVSEFAFLGGNHIDLDEERPPVSGPVLHLRVYSLLGGSDVKRGRTLPRADRGERGHHWH